ncbi:alpha/beta fold hydrolase [Acidicapsa acidisoli]|uniref:alpha/beta fold hydrolase n=1 Tax=Acidicapsa acidisoli TaxID=1615681 RepID=UPI0021E0C09F|nr:alpha/beta hydrolase [Acidicapsa acidisoli]
MARKKLFWTLSVAFLAGLTCAGSAFYSCPTWVFGHIQELRMRATGAESRVVMIDGHRIHYYVSGPVSGSPIVLIHGLGGRSEDFVSLTPYLEKSGYRVYAPDLLGFGQSEEPINATYSISDQASLVANFFDAMGLRRTDLAGWSMGGWIAQKVAVDHPERVSRLILMDSAGLTMPPTWDTRLFTPTTPAELDQLDALLMPHPPAVPRFVAKDILRISASYAWVVKRAVASMLTAKDVMDEDLPSLKMPVLILWGRLDRITPLSEGEAIHLLIPQSHMVVASGCGHLAPLSCSSVFGPAITRFLETSYSRPASQPMIVGE